VAWAETTCPTGSPIGSEAPPSSPMPSPIASSGVDCAWGGRYGAWISPLQRAPVRSASSDLSSSDGQ